MINLEELTQESSEQLLMEAIVPRPLMWVTTGSEFRDGAVTIAPFSAISPICNKPAILLLPIQKRRDGSRKRTADNILRTGEFVLNSISSRQIDSAVSAADPALPWQDRVETAGLSLEPCRVVGTSRVAQSDVSIECSLLRYEEIGDGPRNSDLFFGRAVFMWQSAERSRSDVRSLQYPEALIGALGLEWYLTSDGLRRIPQPYAFGERATSGESEPQINNTCFSQKRRRRI